MIVVDTNVVAYLLLPGEWTTVSEAVFRRDPDWAAPLLWSSELRNVLALYVKRQGLELIAAVGLAERAERLFAGREFAVPAARVLEIAFRSGLSAYDAEFVTLAEDLSVPLVTHDRGILASCPGIAVAAEDFEASSP